MQESPIPPASPSDRPRWHQGECYIFLNQLNFVTANNLSVGGGRLTSASWGLYPERLAELVSGTIHWRLDRRDDACFGGFLSPFGAVRLQEGGPRAQLEFDAERIRAEAFPHLPSRFAGLFVFPDQSSCQHAHDLYRWDLAQVKRMSYTAVRSARLDMEIVSLADSLYAAGPVAPALVEQIWNTYWSGGVVDDIGLMPPRRSLWELLLDGVVEPAA